MGRAARSSRYTYAPWPDPGLRAAAAELPGLPAILRTVLDHRADVALSVDFTAGVYFPPGDPSEALNPGSHHRSLRLEWVSRWEGHTFHSNRVYALESHDEFYAGPLLGHHPADHGLAGQWFVEVVSDPNPWIAELVAENRTGIFPPSGQPIMLSEAERRRNPHLTETGRFFPEGAGPEALGQSTDFYWTGAEPSKPGEWDAALAQARAGAAAAWEDQRQRPRYRHLLILSESHVLEVLCEDLPVWRWLS